MALFHHILSLSLLVIAATGVLSESLPDEPPQVSFNISNCIMAKGGFRFAVNYLDKQDKNVTGQFDIQKNATATGNCNVANGTQQELTVTIQEGWKMKMTFMQNNKSEWYVSKVDIDFQITTGQKPFPEGKNVTGSASVSGEMYKTAINSSYQCVAASNVNFTNAQVLGFETNKFQLQAFKFSNETKFDSPVGCPADQVSNIVPIAVGAALGALVIIVLIAYFIGRSRNKRGYESV